MIEIVCGYFAKMLIFQQKYRLDIGRHSYRVYLNSTILEYELSVVYGLEVVLPSCHVRVVSTA
jgi:hypothetical protein